MPTELHIVRTSDFVRQNARGDFDFESSRQVLMELARVCAGKGVQHALLDVRDMYGELTATELHKLARSFAESGFRKTDCLAVLHRYAGTKADIFAAFAGDMGMNVRAFDNYEDAMEWFSTALPATDPPAG